LLSDGRVLLMEAGRLSRTIETKSKSTAGTVPTKLFTSTDAGDLYLLRSASGTVPRISKAGQTLGTYAAPAGMDNLSTLDRMTVDESRGKIYLVQGRRVYEAGIPGRTGQSAESAPRPTVEP